MVALTGSHGRLPLIQRAAAVVLEKQGLPRGVIVHNNYIRPLDFPPYLIAYSDKYTGFEPSLIGKPEFLTFGQKA